MSCLQKCKLTRYKTWHNPSGSELQTRAAVNKHQS